MDNHDSQRDQLDTGGHALEHDHAEHEHAEHVHHHDHAHHHEEPMTQEEAVRSLLLLGQVAIDEGDYEAAAEAYRSLLKLEPNETASFNLASFHARGLGARKNYLEAARLFHQAELLGNSQAQMLCGKCMYDFIHEGIDAKTPMDVYAAMAVFVSRVYPEAEEKAQEVGHGLIAVAGTCYEKGEHARASKVFRAAAEFANDGYAQYYLAQLYIDGTGVQQSDLAALYWLDCAVDNGAGDVAIGMRDAILDAYRQSFADREFSAKMEELSAWCEQGTDDIPANPDKAAQWRGLA